MTGAEPAGGSLDGAPTGWPQTVIGAAGAGAAAGACWASAGRADHSPHAAAKARTRTDLCIRELSRDTPTRKPLFYRIVGRLRGGGRSVQPVAHPAVGALR